MWFLLRAKGTIMEDGYIDHITGMKRINAIAHLQRLVKSNAPFTEIEAWLDKWRPHPTVFGVLQQEWFKIIDKELL
jgi:hypothetical protein